MTLKEQTILIISTEPWGDMWFSKHNWAYELSKHNNVFFINAPKTWSFKDLFKFRIQVTEYSKSLKIIDYNNRLPFTRYELIFQLNEYFIARGFRKWFEKENIKEPVFWSFDPYRFSNPQLLNPSKSIFFRVDIFFLKKREKELIQNVDGVIVTAKELLKGVDAKKELVLSHGISDEEFKYDKEIQYGKGYFLYVGQIDHRLDLPLLERMLLKFPNERFLFIGKVVDINDELFHDIFTRSKYKNMIVHGVEHFKNLKNYIYNSKACLVPMDLKVHGNAVHHHKSLQYLAMGKPVISPIFNDEVNKGEFILGYKNSDEAITRIQELDLYETEEKVKNRINFAKQFLYSNLIKKVETFLN